MVQRDYIERLIEECAEALRRALQLRHNRQLDPALEVVREAEERLLGPLRPLLERLEASSAVDVAGRFQHDRVRMYAVLLGEEGLIHDARGDSASAYLCCRRSLELFAAVSLAGAALDEADVQRVAVLRRVVDLGQLDRAYQDEIRRVGTRSRPPG